MRIRPSGAAVLITWGVWSVGWLALRAVSVDYGIAVPMSTSTVIALSRYLSVVFGALLLSPPIALTILWWRRTRRAPTHSPPMP